jgi:hypothetical protein
LGAGRERVNDGGVSADTLTQRSRLPGLEHLPLKHFEEIVMAAILTIRLVGARAFSQAASVFATPRIKTRRPLELFATINRVLIAGDEILRLLWAVVVLAFCLVIVAGFVV